MIDAPFYISVIFRLINFLTVIALFYWLYHRYVVAAIKKEISDQEKDLAFLAQQKDASYQEVVKSQQAIVDQKQLISHLTQCMQTWQNVSEQKRVAHEQEQDTYRQKIASLTTEQSKRFAQYELNQRLFEPVLRDVSSGLKHHFNQKKNSNQYMQQVLTFIRKEM